MSKSPTPLFILSIILNLFYKYLYHHFAWAYNFVANFVSAGYWNDWVSSVLPYVQGLCILELGFGSGKLQYQMRKMGLNVYGVDGSYQMCRLAYCFLCAKGIRIDVVNGYAQILPFSSSSFDLVVSTFPSNSIISKQTLMQVHRVLLPGGTLIVLPIAWVTGKTIRERLSSWLFRFTGQAGEWVDNWTEPFRLAGFQINYEEVVTDSWRLKIILARKEDKKV